MKIIVCCDVAKIMVNCFYFCPKNNHSFLDINWDNGTVG